MTSISPGELGGPAGPKAGRGALALTGPVALHCVRRYRHEPALYP